MPFDQYHEPPEELSQEVRTFARICTSLIEETEAIGWYEQRLSLETDPDARAIMAQAQKEEFLHFAMGLEFLTRRKQDWRTVLQAVLFKEGDIVEAAEEAEARSSSYRECRRTTTRPARPRHSGATNDAPPRRRVAAASPRSTRFAT